MDPGGVGNHSQRCLREQKYALRGRWRLISGVGGFRCRWRIEGPQRRTVAIESEGDMCGGRELTRRGSSIAEDLRRRVEFDGLMISRSPLHAEQKYSGQQDDEDDPQCTRRELWRLFGYHLW